MRVLVRSLALAMALAAIPLASVAAHDGHSTDGKGIDHFFDVYGETLIGALFAALQNA